MTYQEYWSRFVPLVFLFLFIGALLWSTPNLRGPGVLLVIAVLALLVTVGGYAIRGDSDSAEDVLTATNIFMIFCFGIVWYLVTHLGGIIQSTFSALLTIPTLFLYFSFKVNTSVYGQSPGRNSYLKWIALVIYAVTLVMFDPASVGWEFSNPILQFVQSDNIERVVSTTDFHRTSILVFYTCVAVMFVNLPLLDNAREWLANWLTP